MGRVVYLIFLFLSNFIQFSSGQKIVDQTYIDPDEPVFLNEPMSILGFDTVFEVGDAFPDFETISTEGEIFNLTQILQTAIEETRVPVFMLGRPSCFLLRHAYEEIVLPVAESNHGDLKIYHMANSIEPHATNGYPTPYFAYINGQLITPDQTPSENSGYEFQQPFTGQELIDLSADFVSKMVETNTGSMEDFAEVTILMDDPSGGFTQTFGGPAIIWVLNPFTGTVVYEKSDFGNTCYGEQHGEECPDYQLELLEAVNEVKGMFQLVDVESTDIPAEMVELEWFNMFGQEGAGQFKVRTYPYNR